jgi:hypothetical protein
MNDKTDRPMASVSRPAVVTGVAPARPTVTGTTRRVMGTLDRLTEDERVKVVRALADLYLPSVVRQA